MLDSRDAHELVDGRRSLPQALERLCVGANGQREGGIRLEAEELEDVGGARHGSRPEAKQGVGSAGERARALPHCLLARCSIRFAWERADSGRRKPPFPAGSEKRMKGLEPSTFCMASQRPSRIATVIVTYPSTSRCVPLRRSRRPR